MRAQQNQNRSSSRRNGGVKHGPQANERNGSQGWQGYAGEQGARSSRTEHLGTPGRDYDYEREQSYASEAGRWGEENMRYWGSIADERNSQLPLQRGKPPKGYARSDERIRDDICERLVAANLDASEMEIEVRDGEVELKGGAPSRDIKHRAEHIAASVLGVKDVTNHLRIQRD
ncbi:MAG TPA: BON domain-containing protein [Polyangiaceae bacterium]|nr:BON domain-containing protein [Polyangiaceae bacterium]